MNSLSKNKKKGNYAETYAAGYLRRQNYTLLARNYSFRGGELDIVAQSPQKELVFVEIKSVWTSKKGSPIHRVSKQKQLKIWKTACHFLHFNGGENQKCRFDVIAISLDQTPIRFIHLKNAFESNQTIHECHHAF
ncbi:MAG: YraN family protein [Fibrobacter sp.]|jgi:putative endonuclease|nr:YraN family protein [Fibrobacter sp.]